MRKTWVGRGVNVGLSLSIYDKLVQFSPHNLAEGTDIISYGYSNLSLIQFS